MGIDFQVYQIYYHDSQLEHFFSDTIPYFNDDLGIYFENEVILDLYRKGKIIGDYFGVLSWKTRIKNNIRTDQVSNFINERYALYSFTYDKHDVLGYANVCHPEFSKIFNELLVSLGIDLHEKPLVGLYQNAIITRTEIYLDYVENFLLPAIDFFENCSDEINQLLYMDANYRGVDAKMLQQELGVQHYTHHTFILERLWSLYYHIRRDKNSFRYRWLKMRCLKPVKVDSKGTIHKFNIQKMEK